MATTTFTDFSTPIVSSWLNDVNSLTYTGLFATGVTAAKILSTGTDNSTINFGVNGLGSAAFVGVPGIAGALINSASAGDLIFRTNAKAQLWSVDAGATTAFQLSTSGVFTARSSTSALGYGTGSGGTVTQLTSKATGVTLNRGSGRITMNSAALASNAQVGFTLTNSVIESTDVLVCHMQGGNATGGTYQVWVDGVGTGVAAIYVKNISGGSLSEAVILQFAIIKGSTS